jgi:tetratricopeptide (TPR) repeat protein
MFGSKQAGVYADFLAARYAGMVGDPQEAALYYRRAFTRAPTDAGALESAVFATLIAGDAGAAVDLARGADKAVSAAAPSAQLALIVDDIAEGRSARALARLKSSRLGVINQDVASFLFAWLGSETDVDTAVTELTQPPTRRFPGGEVFYFKGLILSANGRDEEALKAFSDGARFPTGSGPILASAHARLLASRGEVDKARQVLEAQINFAGPSSETELTLAMLDSGQPVTPMRLGAEEGAAAAIFLASAGGLARSSPELMTMRLSLALLIDPDFTPARLALTDALEDQERSEEALAVLAKVNSASPWYATAKLRMSSLHERLGQRDLAIAAADAAIASSRRRDILLGAGDLNRNFERWPVAEALYDQVVKADQASGRRDWRPIFARATALEQMGRWQEAEAEGLEALAIEPKRPELLNFIGYAWVDRGEKVAAGMELIRQAVAARPDSGYIIDSLGWAHYRLGEYDKAIEQLERAVELEPGNAEIVDHLGDAYWRAGRRAEAAFEWQDAARLKPGMEKEIRGKLAHGLDPAPRIVAEAPQAEIQGRP